MTTRTTTPRVFTSDRLFTAAFIVGVMLVPHVVIGSLAPWPLQPFTLHAAIVVLLTVWGFDARRQQTRSFDSEIEEFQRMIEKEG